LFVSIVLYLLARTDSFHENGATLWAETAAAVCILICSRQQYSEMYGSMQTTGKISENKIKRCDEPEDQSCRKNKLR